MLQLPKRSLPDRLRVSALVLKLLRTQITNCQNSVEEPGCLRFDLFRSDADPNHLIIEEMYQTSEDAAKHKETAHYLTWREAVADCMEKPREGMGVTPLFTQRPELRAPYARWSSSAGTVKNSWLGKGDAGGRGSEVYPRDARLPDSRTTFPSLARDAGADVERCDGPLRLLGSAAAAVARTGGLVGSAIKRIRFYHIHCVSLQRRRATHVEAIPSGSHGNLILVHSSAWSCCRRLHSFQAVSSHPSLASSFLLR